MSFGESVFSTGFIQKTVKVDLHVRINHAYPAQNRHQKVLEDTRGHRAEVNHEWLLGVAGWPNLKTIQPLGPTYQPLLLCRFSTAS